MDEKSTFLHYMEIVDVSVNFSARKKIIQTIKIYTVKNVYLKIKLFEFL